MWRDESMLEDYRADPLVVHHKIDAGTASTMMEVNFDDACFRYITWKCFKKPLQAMGKIDASKIKFPVLILSGERDEVTDQNGAFALFEEYPKVDKILKVTKHTRWLCGVSAAGVKRERVRERERDIYISRNTSVFEFVG